MRSCGRAQTFLIRQSTLVRGTRTESRPWSSNTPSWVRSSELALSGFESELFVAAMRSMTPRARSRCIGSANWRNRAVGGSGRRGNLVSAPKHAFFGRAQHSSARYQKKVRGREDSLGPSRTGVSTRDACTTQTQTQPVTEPCVELHSQADEDRRCPTQIFDHYAT